MDAHAFAEDIARYILCFREEGVKSIRYYRVNTADIAYITQQPRGIFQQLVNWLMPIFFQKKKNGILEKS